MADDPGAAMRSWAEAFGDEPWQWGLRGDPYVWREMARRLTGSPAPSDAEDARARLLRCFADVVGVELSDPDLPEAVHRPELAHGGMSSGQVHLHGWRDRLVPLLIVQVCSRGPEPRAPAPPDGA
jgi:hypothetical protein